MHEIKIELIDVEAAGALRSLLRSHGLDADGSVDGPECVAVGLIAHNPEHRIESLLSIVDAWLERTGHGPVTVHLDGSSYLLGEPPANRLSERPPQR